MESKKWFQSKTLWAGLLGVLTALGAYFSQGAPWTEVVSQFGLLAMAVVTIALRMITKQPID